MDKIAFDNFFKPYAKNVDQAENILFWQLSDDIIFEIIKKSLPDNLSEADVILDAGGGTGRWVIKLSKVFSSRFILYDLSEDMLNQAKENIGSAGLNDRVKIINGDLAAMDRVADESVSHAVSIYSPISFIQEKGKAAAELCRVLKPGGRLLMMGHGYYNAIASKINNYRASAEELRRLESEHAVKWAPHVPTLNVFSRETMEKMLADAGFKIVCTYGVPVFVQPGMEDFDPENKKQSPVSQALGNPDFYQEVFALEMKYNGHPDIANRGVNIFTVVEK